MEIERDWLDWASLFVTGILLGVAVWQIVLLRQTLRATELAAHAASKSADVAAAAYQLTDRPWLQVRAAIDGPLTFTTTAATLRIKIVVKNLGRSAAQHVDVKAFMTPWYYVHDGNTQQMRDGVWARFAAFLQTQEPEMGFAILPGEEMARIAVLQVAITDLEATWQRFVPSALDLPIHRRGVPLLICGRVTYAQLGVAAHRASDFGYVVAAASTANGISADAPLGTNHAQDQLTLIISALGLQHAT
ncbi:MAG: hypothetical protein ABL971_15220 [Vicinamibacterales bacterium]